MNKKIGFIGLGAMGRPMAANILRAGFDLTVYDIRTEPMQELEKLGAKAARSPQEVGAQCEIIETIVVNDTQVEEVILGKDSGGVLDGPVRAQSSLFIAQYPPRCANTSRPWRETKALASLMRP